MKGPYDIDNRLTEIICWDVPVKTWTHKYAVNESQISEFWETSYGGKVKMRNSFSRFCNKTGGNFYKWDLVI